MPDAEQTNADAKLAAFLAGIEANNALSDHLNSLKVGLEERGWSTPNAEQAAIVTTNTMMQLSTLGMR
ncbi:hypothetical protein [Microbacterium sp. H6]|uniref:hypothetical protein n=1 Tax=Microbacterium sp. H6 TaxID=421122 RepID=UPI000DE52AB1|nr:hypothetical protein [Microbacterium sp. H6]RBO73490.1 hypothetical protein DSP71_04865 [Microbacterium sp. H6]